MKFHLINIHKVAHSTFNEILPLISISLYSFSEKLTIIKQNNLRIIMNSFLFTQSILFHHRRLFCFHNNSFFNSIQKTHNTRFSSHLFWNYFCFFFLLLFLVIFTVQPCNLNLVLNSKYEKPFAISFKSSFELTMTHSSLFAVSVFLHQHQFISTVFTNAVHRLCFFLLSLSFSSLLFFSLLFICV